MPVVDLLEGVKIQHQYAEGGPVALGASPFIGQPLQEVVAQVESRELIPGGQLVVPRILDGHCRLLCDGREHGEAIDVEFSCGGFHHPHHSCGFSFHHQRNHEDGADRGVVGDGRKGQVPPLREKVMDHERTQRSQCPVHESTSNRQTLLGAQAFVAINEPGDDFVLLGVGHGDEECARGKNLPAVTRHHGADHGGVQARADLLADGIEGRELRGAIAQALVHATNSLFDPVQMVEQVAHQKERHPQAEKRCRPRVHVQGDERKH